jgi:excisionase family DNA binding protein
MVLTVKEVAVRLRCEHKTVRKLISDGKLKAFRLGRALRIKESDYEDFISKSYE